MAGNTLRGDPASPREAVYEIWTQGLPHLTADGRQSPSLLASAL